MHEWLKQLTGRFVVFDGPDGSGKSTQFTRFARFCREQGLEVCEVREPGGTEVGEQIRRILLDPQNTDMSLRCEMMLYMASRAQLIEQVIKPAREAGKLILADRFISSTLAYQGTAGGMTREEIMEVGQVAIGGNWPDLVVVFDIDEKTSARRMGGSAFGVGQPSLFADRIELRESEFHQRVRQGYLDQAAADPDRHLLIDASPDESTVFETLLEALTRRFES